MTDQPVVPPALMNRIGQDAADRAAHAAAVEAAIGRSQPAERCGDMTESITGTGWYECVLRPGHSGSHADHSNMRWAAKPKSDLLDVAGRCPACRGASLFVGSGGHVTCARIDCPNPTAADDLLHAPTGPLVTGTLAQLGSAAAELVARLDDHVNAVRKAVS